MSGTVLLLGPVAFQDFEVASGVSFGGVQRVVQHELPGGGRVIDAMGDDQSQISVSGFLSGPEASSRALTLSGLRGAGAVLPLTWDVFFYSVVVQAFQAEYRSPWWIPFRLTCAVLRDEAAAILGGVVSLAGSVVADVAAAIAAAPATVDLSSAAAAIAQPEAATFGTTAYGAAQEALGASVADLDGGFTAAEAAFDPNGVFDAASPAQGIAAVNAAGAGAGLMTGLITSRAFVRRAAANLADAST